MKNTPQPPNPNKNVLSRPTQQTNVISGISYILTVAFKPDTIAWLSNIFIITATQQNMSYWLQKDIHNYLQASQLPALDEFTMCFFFEPNQQNLLSIVSPEAQIEALISIASEGRSHNSRGLFSHPRVTKFGGNIPKGDNAKLDFFQI